MLVLSRKQGERIMIGEGVTVTVMEIRGDRIKLGFECPTAVPVHREEVYRRLRASAHNTPPSAKGSESPFFAEFA